MRYKWSDNPTIFGSKYDVDLLNECLMHLKYENNAASNQNLFDVKITDRILDESESYGWKLQGSLINSNYAAAVDKIRNEFETAEIIRKYEKRKNVELPTFTANATNDIEVSDSLGNANAYLFMTGTSYKTTGNWANFWFNINYNRPVYLKSYGIKADSNGNPEYPQAWTLRGSDDGVNWDILDTQSGHTFSLGQLKTFNVELEKTYVHYRLCFSAGLHSSGNGELSQLFFDAEYVDNSFEYKIAANGHLLADISQKAEIDKYFTETGVADFYIFDPEGNRFYLPRNKWFMQFTTDISKLNEYQAPGIPDHWHYVDEMPNTKNRPRGDDRTNCTTYYETKKTRLASECNPIYGNSDSVQPPSSLKLLYYFVGENE